MKIILLSKVENYMPIANYKREEDNAREGKITAERHKLCQHNRRYISVALRFLPQTVVLARFKKNSDEKVRLRIIFEY